MRRPLPGEPPWGMAQLYPEQGGWTEEEYLALDTNILVEFVDGCLEFPPMPVDSQQALLAYLYDTVREFIRPRRLGTLRFAALKVRVGQKKYREPDLLFLRSERDQCRHEQYWETADLVVEVVSKDDPDRDWITRRTEYAVAGIAEYWIVDPRDRTLTVFTLDPGTTTYREAGRYREGESAKSILLDGLTVDVTAAFASR